MSSEASTFLRRLRQAFTPDGQPASRPPMVDVHMHILPNVDDGSKDWDMTLAMCEQAHADGTAHIVATPHASEQWFYDREQHARSLDELRERFPSLDFSLGCDLNCSFDNVEDAMRHPRRYTIGDTQYLLVEFNYYSTKAQINGVLRAFRSVGLTSIITHPERLPLIIENPLLVEDFADSGALIQVTANALTGGWGPRVQRVAERLIKKRLVTVIASDAHDSERRVPILSEAHSVVSRLLTRTEADCLVSSNPRAIVNNQSV